MQFPIHILSDTFTSSASFGYVFDDFEMVGVVPMASHRIADQEMVRTSQIHYLSKGNTDSSQEVAAACNIIQGSAFGDLLLKEDPKRNIIQPWRMTNG